MECLRESGDIWDKDYRIILKERLHSVAVVVVALAVILGHAIPNWALCLLLSCMLNKLLQSRSQRRVWDSYGLKTSSSPQKCRHLLHLLCITSQIQFYSHLFNRHLTWSTLHITFYGMLVFRGGLMNTRGSVSMFNLLKKRVALLPDLHSIPLLHNSVFFALLSLSHPLVSPPLPPSF